MQYISYNENQKNTINKLTEEQRKENNEKYIEEKLKQEKNFLDKMYKNIDKNIKLDYQQRKIILTEEDYIMVIAGAGSGKTTTIAAKVNFLIKRKKISEEEIIVITYTNKAVNELKKRINQDFNINIKIVTFHKFGYEIIKQSTANYPKINKDKEKIINDIIEQELTKSKKYIIKCEILKKLLEHIINIITKIKNKNNKQIKKLCLTIISLLKAKGYDADYLENIKTNTKKQKKLILLTQIVLKKYNQYQNKKNIIDFDDIIHKAIKIIKENKIKPHYKYIIIDEYQDISENRYNLIMELSKINESKVMTVGDDWQCIYGFAASNINLFTNIQKNIPHCEIMKIEKTYRNSQELIDIAGKFIKKNNKQIDKQLKSDKHNDHPLKIIICKKDIHTIITKVLDYIIKKYGVEKNILILGRYKFDKNKIIDNIDIIEKENRIIYKKHPQVKIEYMTVHSSKGLGYDNVILINSKNEKMGFPSKKKKNKIIQQLVVEEKNIKYAEERRLFYVAMTRTKNEIMIITPQKKQSKFIKEIKKHDNVKYISNIKEIINR